MYEEDQYSYVYKTLSRILSIAFKQTKAGPLSSGVNNEIKYRYFFANLPSRPS